MKTIGNSGYVELPPSLFAEVEAAANEAHRTAGELVHEAVQRYLDGRRWQRLYAHGEERAHTMGMTEADVTRLIAQYRQEKPQDHK